MAGVDGHNVLQIVNWKVQPHALDDLEKLLVDLKEESLELIVSNIIHINQLLKQSNDREDANDAADDTSSTHGM